MSRLGSLTPSTPDLSFLTRDGAGRASGVEIRTVPLSAIIESDQLRLREPPYPHVGELGAAIQRDGQSTPLFVRPLADGQYELISGYRRRAALESIAAPAAIVRIYEGLSDAEAFSLAVSENADRKALTDWERAVACQRMRDDGVPVDEIARRFSWSSRRSAENHLRIAREASPPLREALQHAQIAVKHAVELLKAFAQHSTPEPLQQEIIQTVIVRGLSAAKIPRLVAQHAAPSEPSPSPRIEGWHISESKTGVISFRGRAMPDNPDQLEAVANELASLLRKLRNQRRRLLSQDEQGSPEQ